MRPHPFYDSKQWHSLRLMQLAEEPHCRYCARLGRYTRATWVDHVKPHHGRAALFFNHRNLQSLCASCHSQLKQSLERRSRSAVTLEGRPIARSHPWNRRRRQTV